MKIIISIVFFLSFFIPRSAQAYEMVKGPDDKYTDSFQADLDKDNMAETVTLLRKTPQDETMKKVMDEAIIYVISKGNTFSKDAGVISSHSSGIEEIVISDNIKPFIAVSSFASGSAHAWGVTLFSFNGKEILEELDIVSDGPSIEVNDVDNDGVKEIVVKWRDYENRPWEDSYFETYKYIDNKWRLVSVYRTKTKEWISVDDWVKEHYAFDFNNI